MKYLKIFFIFILACIFFIAISFYILPMILFLILPPMSVAESYRFIYYIEMTIVFATIVTCTHLILKKLNI